MEVNSSFGAEIEFFDGVKDEGNREEVNVYKEGADRVYERNGWDYQDDCSVACEYVSPPYQKVDYLLDEGNDALKYYKGVNSVGEHLHIPFFMSVDEHKLCGQHIHFGRLDSEFGTEMRRKMVKCILPLHPLLIGIQAMSPFRDNKSDRTLIGRFCNFTTEAERKGARLSYPEYSLNGLGTLEIRNLDGNILQTTSAVITLLKPICDNLEDIEPIKITKEDYKKRRKLACKTGLEDMDIKDWFLEYYLTLTKDVNLNKLPNSTKQILVLALVEKKNPLDLLLNINRGLKNDEHRHFYNWWFFELMTRDAFKFKEHFEEMDRMFENNRITEVLYLLDNLPEPKYLTEILDLIEDDSDRKSLHLKNAIKVKERGDFSELRKEYEKKEIDNLKEQLNKIDKMRIKNEKDLDEIDDINIPSKEIYTKILNPDYDKVRKAIEWRDNKKEEWNGNLLEFGRIWDFSDKVKNGEMENTNKIVKQLKKLDLEVNPITPLTIGKKIKEIKDSYMEAEDVIDDKTRYYTSVDLERLGENKDSVIGFSGIDVNEGKIEDIWVDENYRRIGIGSELVIKMKTASQQRLYCFINNNTNDNVKEFLKDGNIKATHFRNNNGQLWIERTVHWKRKVRNMIEKQKNKEFREFLIEEVWNDIGGIIGKSIDNLTKLTDEERLEKSNDTMIWGRIDIDKGEFSENTTNLDNIKKGYYIKGLYCSECGRRLSIKDVECPNCGLECNTSNDDIVDSINLSIRDEVIDKVNKRLEASIRNLTTNNELIEENPNKGSIYLMNISNNDIIQRKAGIRNIMNKITLSNYIIIGYYCPECKKLLTMEDYTDEDNENECVFCGKEIDYTPITLIKQLDNMKERFMNGTPINNLDEEKLEDFENKRRELKLFDIKKFNDNGLFRKSIKNIMNNTNCIEPRDDDIDYESVVIRFTQRPFGIKIFRNTFDIYDILGLITEDYKIEGLYCSNCGCSITVGDYKEEEGIICPTCNSKLRMMDDSKFSIKKLINKLEIEELEKVNLKKIFEVE